MQLNPDFDMLEKVRLTDGNYKNAIGIIVGMEIDVNIHIVYEVEVTTTSIHSIPFITILKRKANQIAHTENGTHYISHCRSCGNVKPIAFDDICIDCLPAAKEEIKDSIKKFKNEVKSKKRKLFNGVIKSNIEKEYVFSLILQTLRQVESLEENLVKLKAHA